MPGVISGMSTSRTYPFHRHPWVHGGCLRPDPFAGVFLCPTHQRDRQTDGGFKPKQQADPGWIIGPDKSINEAVIRDNWDDLLRLVATIKLKENTASDIFRRLNSYSRQHALYQTLKAVSAGCNLPNW